MIATTHALIAGAIASSVQNPALGITLSAISHPFLDIIPHWDFGWGWRQKTKKRLFTESFLDLIVGIILAYIFFGRFINFWYFLACITVSIGWDVAESPYWLLNWKFPPFSWVYKVQSRMQGKARLPWGIINQIIVVTATVFILSRIN